MTTETPQAPAPPPPDMPRKSPFGSLSRHRPRISLGVFILAVVIGAYGFSLFGVHYLQRSEGPLPPLDLSQGGGNDTIVQLRLDDFKTTANRLKVDVLVYPPDSLYDKRFDVLNTDVAVRLYPTNDLGDLQFPKGKAPAQVETTIEAHGDPASWPFDTYKTEKISADTFIGSGDERKKIPARVEVTGGLDGWDVDVNRVDETSGVNSRGLDDAQLVITMKRAKGPCLRHVHLRRADQPADSGVVGGHSDGDG